MAKNTREMLLHELDSYRWMIILQLADEAEERGEDGVVEARGWRWLERNKRWPRSAKRASIGMMFSWSFFRPFSATIPQQNRWMREYDYLLPSSICSYKNLKDNPSVYLSTLLAKTAASAGEWIVVNVHQGREIPDISEWL